MEGPQVGSRNLVAAVLQALDKLEGVGCTGVMAPAAEDQRALAVPATTSDARSPEDLEEPAHEVTLDLAPGDRTLRLADSSVN